MISLKKEKDTEVARTAVQKNWGESYSSPQDAAEPLAAGTLDICGDGSKESPYFLRVWCADGTARNVPQEIFESLRT